MVCETPIRIKPQFTDHKDITIHNPNIISITIRIIRLDENDNRKGIKIGRKTIVIQLIPMVFYLSKQQAHPRENYTQK